MTHSIGKTILRLALIGAAALPLAACGMGPDGKPLPFNRSVDSVHQPVVSYTSFTYDVQAGGNGDLAPAEQARLEEWLNSINLGYGDHVAVVAGQAAYGRGLRDGIALVVARRGLLIEEDTSAVAGTAPEGSVRLIVRRASAGVPGCPDWHDKAESNGVTSASANYGCASNANLAAMVANPDDLVRGQATDSDLRTATSNRAIQAYRDKAPTGAGALQTISASTGAK
jgi:pilus assembly protein CpaD